MAQVDGIDLAILMRILFHSPDQDPVLILVRAFHGHDGIYLIHSGGEAVPEGLHCGNRAVPARSHGEAAG